MIISLYKPKTLTLVIGNQAAELFIPPFNDLYITFNDIGQILAWDTKPIYNDEEYCFESSTYEDKIPVVIGRVDDSLSNYMKTTAFHCFKLDDGNFEKHL